MRTVIAQFTVLPDKAPEAEAAMKKLAAAVDANEPGTLVYLWHRNVKDPARIMVFEVYADDGAVQAHRESSHLAEFVALFNAGTVFDAASTSIERYQRFAGVQR
jgi:quinol monooxygenase YgiN